MPVPGIRERFSVPAACQALAKQAITKGTWSGPMDEPDQTRRPAKKHPQNDGAQSYCPGNDPGNSPGSDNVEIGSSPRKILLRLMLGVVAVALCLWMFLTGGEALRSGQSRDSLAYLIRIVGLVGMVFFGACLVAGLIRLMRHRDSVVSIQPELIRIPGLPDLPWSEISDIKVVPIQRERMVVLFLESAGARRIDATSGYAKRRLHRFNRYVYGAPAVPLPGMLAADPDKLAAWLREVRVLHTPAIAISPERASRANPSGPRCPEQR